MRLKINGEPVDYTLEKESVLSDVVKGVRDWLGSSGYVITGIRAGDKDLLASPREEWAGTSISSVAELDFLVGHPEDLRIERWIAVRTLLGMVERELDSPGQRPAEVLQEIPGALEGLRKNPPSAGGAEDAGRLLGLLKDLGDGGAARWPAERLREARELITRVRDELEGRIGDASRPREALARRIAQLSTTRESIGTVSVLLQSGKDRQAMEIVVSFSDLVQALLAILPFLPPDDERQRLFGELNGVLKELVAAFDARDLVLIGDLFEYEVAPRIDRLIPLLQRCL